MALAKGNSGCTTGLSKRIYDFLVADRARGSFTGAATAAETDFQKWLAWACAQGIVDEIVANSVAAVTIQSDASGDGLQQSGGVDTTRPTAPRIIYGSVG